MEYPVLECKEAAVNFWTLWFPIIFAVAFGMSGLSVLLISFFIHRNLTLLLVGFPFFLTGIYQPGNTLKIYGINDKIDIIVYQNYYMIA